MLRDTRIDGLLIVQEVTCIYQCAISYMLYYIESYPKDAWLKSQCVSSNPRWWQFFQRFCSGGWRVLVAARVALAEIDMAQETNHIWLVVWNMFYVSIYLE